MPSKIYVHSNIDAKKNPTIFTELKLYFNQSDSILVDLEKSNHFFQLNYANKLDNKLINIQFYTNETNYKKFLNLINKNKKSIIGYKEELMNISSYKYIDFNTDTNEIHNKILEENNLLNSYDSLIARAEVNANIVKILEKKEQIKYNIANLKYDLKKIRFANKFGYEINLTIYKNFSLYQYNQGLEWEDFFMPGLCYNFLKLSNNDSLKNFYGFSPEFTFYSRYKSDANGPSIIKSAIKMGILNGEDKKNGILFTLSVATNCSFENKVYRRVFIPYFGVELGYISQKKIGSSFYIQPNLGVHLYSSKRILISAQSNYLYTLKNTQTFQNSSYSIGFNCLLWD